MFRCNFLALIGSLFVASALAKAPVPKDADKSKFDFKPLTDMLTAWSKEVGGNGRCDLVIQTGFPVKQKNTDGTETIKEGIGVKIFIIISVGQPNDEPIKIDGNRDGLNEALGKAREELDNYLKKLKKAPDARKQKFDFKPLTDLLTAWSKEAGGNGECELRIKTGFAAKQKNADGTETVKEGIGVDTRIIIGVAPDANGIIINTNMDGPNVLNESLVKAREELDKYLKNKKK